MHCSAALERGEQLRPEAAREALVENADGRDRLAARKVPGAEHEIPQHGGAAEVAVRNARVLRVVPAVRLRAADHVVEPSIAQLHVAVLEESVHRINQEVAGKGFRRHAQQQERQRVAAEMQGLLERMEAPRVEGVEQIRCVMHLMQTPQPVEAVTGAMQPVTQEIDSQHDRQRLRDHWPGVRPPSAPRARVRPIGEHQHCSAQQDSRQQHLHDQQEGGIGLDVRPRWLPARARRAAYLQPQYRKCDHG